MTRRKIYLACAQLVHFYRNPRLPACGCGQPAGYVQMTLSAFRPELHGYACWKSSYCAECVDRPAKRRNMEVVNDETRLRQIYQDLWDAQRQAHELQRQEHAKQKAATMAEFGKVLAMSGFKGRMFEMPDGSLRCEMRDGTAIVPCCWLEGSRIIDNRIRDKNASGHNANCTRLQSSACPRC